MPMPTSALHDDEKSCSAAKSKAVFPNTLAVLPIQAGVYLGSSWRRLAGGPAVWEPGQRSEPPAIRPGTGQMARRDRL